MKWSGFLSAVAVVLVVACGTVKDPPSTIAVRDYGVPSVEGTPAQEPVSGAGIVQTPGGDREHLAVRLSSGEADGVSCGISFVEYKPGHGAGAPLPEDMMAVRNSMAEAVDRSPAMKDNLQRACARAGNAIVIRVKRDDPKQLISQAVRDDLVEVDVADIERAGRFMSGGLAETDVLARSLLYAVLAHEIVHLRDGLQAHRHRLGQELTASCPAIEDETSVLSQLGFHVRRENYAYLANGRLKADFSVDGLRVVLNISDLADASK